MKIRAAVLVVVLVLAFGVTASADTLDNGLAFTKQGSPTTLSGAPDYDWWYGCSPTSAGMMMAYYDINGYGGLRYNNLVQGGTAEASTYYSTFGNWEYLAQYAIASPGHVSDFYVGGYGASGDDTPNPSRQFNSLADFMGTSQDAIGNSNGSTTFFYYTDGSKLTAAQIESFGLGDNDGMYGLYEYFLYAGYAADLNSFYTQPTDNVGYTYGFTFQDYVAEIDAGRVVMIHVEGHSMFGYGYDLASGSIILYDTWSPGYHSMAWGGSYADMDLWGVTVFIPSGGTAAVPVPAAIWLFGSGLLGLAGLRKRQQRNNN
ncbi:MAG: VPLPA-CTERM sorting domain-containing protein [Thermodesulfobacteriota bacterium]